MCVYINVSTENVNLIKEGLQMLKMDEFVICYDGIKL